MVYDGGMAHMPESNCAPVDRFSRGLPFRDKDRNGDVERMPDTELMRQVQRGSEPAFGALYRRHCRKLLDYFHGMTRDAQLSEDLCHETFMRIWQLRARYKASGSFVAYLFAIARHILQERYRTVRKERRVERLAESEPERLTVEPATPERLTYRNELGDRIAAALEELPEEQRTAFVLRTVNGLSLEEIAEVMNCPVNTVRSRRLLAVRRLRSLLGGLLAL